MITKSYGDIYLDEYLTNKGNDKEARESACQAVIKEFCARNDEPVAFVDKDRDGRTYGVLKKELPRGTDLFLSPQPKEMVLPEESEIILALETAGLYLSGNDDKIAAKAILELLKEKNKNG